MSTGNLRLGDQPACHDITLPFLHIGPSALSPPAKPTGHIETFLVYLIYTVRHEIINL